MKEIRDYIAEDNAEYAAKTIKEIYGKFENIQMFPGIVADLSKKSQLPNKLQVCDLGELCDHLQSGRRICRDLPCSKSV